MANRIHPTAIIGDGVELGDDNVIGPYAVILGPTTIGHGNWIGPHVVIGTPPENRSTPHVVGWEGEQGEFGVRVGDRNRLREHVTLQGGTHRPTQVGSDCFLLVHSHIGHDVVLGDHVTLAPVVQVAGHNDVWSYANLGMSAAVHQGVAIGPGAMVGMSSAIRKVVKPFSVTVGNPAKAVSVNTVGLSRLGCDDETVQAMFGYLAGREALPDGLPTEVASLLKAWDDRPKTKK
ncbi:UDP-N-acetylglucosamine acyltransferase [Solihabitans fulvus]|uniref:UDP-N-acetylglucosamine acyltransferase n=1 Tax=Solihabitans fulvus TaxID=1892852 RepID=A0A5B2X1L4_9PSEU|nr:UDP-N-acetylglucosamine acyltransferase [Solihabitans fulvus]KAA2257089.1 UDP-N-acetylglucosamine acyltransferase [Solihabitans fulvus]